MTLHESTSSRVLNVLNMTTSLPASTPAQRVLLFGSQALAVDLKFFQKFSSQLRDQNHQWALDAVSSLSELWPDVVRNNPKLENARGDVLLKDLDSALRTGSISESLFPLPNIILTPLTVIVHLIQYSTLLKACLPDLGDKEAVPESVTQTTEILGLCTGILSGFAVGCASTLIQLQQYGTVALRLGMLIGAHVDAEESSTLSTGKAASFSVSWTGAESSVSMDAILDKFPEVRR